MLLKMHFLLNNQWGGYMKGKTTEEITSDKSIVTAAGVETMSTAIAIAWAGPVLAGGA